MGGVFVNARFLGKISYKTYFRFVMFKKTDEIQFRNVFLG